MEARMIDLRSDTVTSPGPGMRQAMAEAKVGDDVYGEDPTINALQFEVADMFGKEEALFVASGTMANQVSLKAHTQPGDEVILHPMAHIFRAEGGAGAALSGVQFRLVGNPDGTMSVAEMEKVISREYNPHIAPTGLICMENTHNFAGGGVVSWENMAAVAEFAKKNKLPCHLDGARVLNAAIALDLKPQKIAEPFDSLTLCFSKGLGAPVGSVIVGSKDFIHRCHRIRKMFGGGMRQAGILAAAAIYALENNVSRLAEDHAAAQMLAEGIINLPGVSLPYGRPDSNILFFQCSHPKMPPEQIISELKERGILMGIVGGMIRAVTHLDVTQAEIEKTLQEVTKLLGN